MINKKGLYALLLFILAGVIYGENNILSKTYIEYQSLKIPKSFDGFKIVQISDLHNKLFGKNQNILIKKIREEKPDIIVITGDIYYSYRHKIKNSLIFLKKIAALYPTYFVSGNHEQRDKNWDNHRRIIQSYGVKIMDGRIENIVKDKDFIQLCGLQDPSFYHKKTRYKVFEQKLQSLCEKLSKSKLCILLSHRPERMDMYAEHKVDLVFSGHAHGGQIRIFNQGILSPGEGFFPKYTAGRYDKNKTTMILSRGLGRTIFTTRLFNRPDIVIVKLKSKH